MSVKQIVSPIMFDNLKNPVKGGLYDPALGPMDAKEKCVFVYVCLTHVCMCNRGINAISRKKYDECNTLTRVDVQHVD